MSEPEHQPPCPKCGYDEYRTRYVPAMSGAAQAWLSRVGVQLRTNQTEGRLQYRCERCRFEWTGACMDAKVEAGQK